MNLRLTHSLSTLPALFLASMAVAQSVPSDTLGAKLEVAKRECEESKSRFETTNDNLDRRGAPGVFAMYGAWYKTSIAHRGVTVECHVRDAIQHTYDNLSSEMDLHLVQAFQLHLAGTPYDGWTQDELTYLLSRYEEAFLRTWLVAAETAPNPATFDYKGKTFVTTSGEEVLSSKND